MTRFGLDAATFVRIARDDRHPAEGHQLVGPGWLRSRALQLLLDEVNAGTLDERAALDLHERLTETTVRLLGDRMSRRTAWQLARQHDWADLADAACLAVTRLQADALLTTDPRLVARADGVVRVADLDELFEPAPPTP